MYIDRWTIEELTESTATLLRSRYQGTMPAIIVNFGKEPRPPLGDELTSLRSEAMTMESSMADEDWPEEVDFVLDRQALQNFIREQRVEVLEPAVSNSRQSQIRDPRPREIREGDVYWVVGAGDLTLNRAYEEPRSIEDTQEFLSPFWESSIWDMTAAARQAAKVAYSRVVKPPEQRKPKG